MQVSRTDKSPCLVELEFEIAPEQYSAALEKAKKHIAKHTEVPGFRPGKAPMPMVERLINPERVKRLAREDVVPEAIEEAIKEQGLDPWTTPSLLKLDDTEEGGLNVATSVQLPPVVELGEYVGLDIERIVRPVDDALIDREIDRQLTAQSRMEPAEGPAEQGDYIYFAIQELDESGEPKGEPATNAAVLGENVPDFDSNATGMQPGETKDFTISYPEDWQEEERAGQSVSVRVTLNNRFRQIKPDLNDEFVQSLGADLKTVDDLRGHVRTIATAAFAEAADEQVTSSILRKILEGSTVHYPHEMLSEQFKHRISDLFHRLEERKLSFEQYLEQSRQSEEEFRQEMNGRIDYEIRIGLLLGAIAEKESIEVSDEEIDTQVEAMLASEESPSQQMLDFMETDEARNAISRRQRTSKIIEFLRGASNIKDVTPSEDEPGEAGGDKETQD